MTRSRDCGMLPRDGAAALLQDAGAPAVIFTSGVA